MPIRNPIIQQRAKAQRKAPSPAANQMWYHIRDRRLYGYKFLREYPVGNFIVDFVCRERKLIIEVDGGQHMDAAEYDQNRTVYLMRQGYQVLRFWNNEVLYQTELVLERILSVLEGR